MHSAPPLPSSPAAEAAPPWADVSPPAAGELPPESAPACWESAPSPPSPAFPAPPSPLVPARATAPALPPLSAFAPPELDPPLGNIGLGWSSLPPHACTSRDAAPTARIAAEV